MTTGSLIAPPEDPIGEELTRLRKLLDAYVADRVATERALRASEERYRSLFERAAFGIYRATEEGRFLEANPALIEMLGYGSIDEVRALDIGRDVYRDRETRAALFREVVSAGLEPWIEAEWKRKDGLPITVRLSARIVRDEAGLVLYCESIVEDITERKRRDELLRRHERLAALGTTLAGVAHELNNPLAAIKGFSQLMLRSPDLVDQTNALETIHRETDRAAKIVRDLLVFARRQETDERQMVDINEVVLYIVATRRYAMETRGVVCRAELAPEQPCVLADAGQLEQVLINLVLNSEQALEAQCDAPLSEPLRHRPRARITVRTSVADGWVALEVEDNGPGVAEADLKRIWDPFWTTKPEGEGTGLGLSVVHGIVSAHGGTIEAESIPGSGMRMVVRLPAADAAADGMAAERARESGDAGADDPAAPLQPAARAPLDILLVDDETSILGFLKEFLESRGHAVLTASDGERALQFAEMARFDVVLCDLRMPGIGGDEVVQRLRRMEGYEQTRFILSTGDNASGSATTRIAAVQPDAVLPKPYDMEQLRRVVEGTRVRARAHG
ncbi:MAG TPA: ATP-binding protein [Gemmatimonadaceae bacterium]|nr:ATP-binding protein [Gemmatimonadaceae bacterium]